MNNTDQIAAEAVGDIRGYSQDERATRDLKRDPLFPHIKSAIEKATEELQNLYDEVAWRQSRAAHASEPASPMCLLCHAEDCTDLSVYCEKHAAAHASGTTSPPATKSPQGADVVSALKNLVAICEGGWIPPEGESEDFVRGWELACGEYRASRSLKLAIAALSQRPTPAMIGCQTCGKIVDENGDCGCTPATEGKK